MTAKEALQELLNRCTKAELGTAAAVYRELQELMDELSE